MEGEALTLRRAALALMDAADLLEEEGRRHEARARVLDIIRNLEAVFWPEIDQPDNLPTPPHD